MAMGIPRPIVEPEFDGRSAVLKPDATIRIGPVDVAKQDFVDRNTVPAHAILPQSQELAGLPSPPLRGRSSENLLGTPDSTESARRSIS
jgi:hypothetical protein